ncbi:hypothetical protein CEXT_506511 [Caerostris extrusa]|uniref:Uncharacterized protein n=1 Tax=Caerostris extrusa TaxID=172846 RepID=A0AAV4QMV6_CAEEX|nr:hypothetical protein CEXT_506511 [Caerostris extrusa]
MESWKGFVEDCAPKVDLCFAPAGSAVIYEKIAGRDWPQDGWLTAEFRGRCVPGITEINFTLSINSGRYSSRQDCDFVAENKHSLLLLLNSWGNIITLHNGSGAVRSYLGRHYCVRCRNRRRTLLLLKGWRRVILMGHRCQIPHLLPPDWMIFIGQNSLVMSEVKECKKEDVQWTLRKGICCYFSC